MTRSTDARALGVEVDAWLDGTTTTEPSPYIYLRRALGGTTLELATQWAKEPGVPFVRRGGALLCRRSDFVRAAAAYEGIQNARAAMEPDDDEWTGANPHRG